MREPLSVEDALKSRIIADPLTLLDCCLITDGAGAIIVSSQDFIQVQKWAQSKVPSANLLTDRARFFDQFAVLVSRPGDLVSAGGGPTFSTLMLLAYEEIAASSGVGVSALKMRVKRACDYLRGRLQEVARDR